MFVSKIFDAIDRLGTQPFEKGNLDIKFDTPIGFFLFELNNFDENSMPKNQFRWIKDKNCAWVTIKQTESNSIQLDGTNSEYLSPKFLATLKKTTLAFLDALASNWKECSEVSELTHYKVEHTFKLDPAAHGVLYDITKHWHLEKQLKITGDSPQAFIEGKRENVEKFLKILKNEAHQVPSLTQLVCEHIVCNLTSEQAQEYQSCLSGELLEKIAKARESQLYLETGQNLTLYK